MPGVRFSITKLLDLLEQHYGRQKPCWPVDPYQFIVWWNCGYPPSDRACTNGWKQLLLEVGSDPAKLLKATPRKLTSALQAGGLVPELRCSRVKEIAQRVGGEFGGDLKSALQGSISGTRRILKTFPGIADPGADRILLFAGIAPIAAVPSSGPQVLVRILHGREDGNYAVNYRRAQESLAHSLPEAFRVRTRAYLLLKRHADELCKRTKPKCEECPLNANCAFFAGQKLRGRRRTTAG